VHPSVETLTALAIVARRIYEEKKYISLSPRSFSPYLEKSGFDWPGFAESANLRFDSPHMEPAEAELDDAPGWTDGPQIYLDQQCRVQTHNSI